MNKIVGAEIVLNDEIAREIFMLKLKLPVNYPIPEPGQFVNLYLNDGSFMLPRPISVCDYSENLLTLVYAVVGQGTKMISDYFVGSRIRVSTPLGKGFSTDGSSPCLLVGGSFGVVPLLLLAKELVAQGQTDVRAAFGFHNETLLVEKFPCTVEVATEDGSCGFKGNVVELLEQIVIPKDTRIFACGSKPMLRALAQFAAGRGLSLQVSMEERMGCGYGACVSCVCKTVRGSRKVCEDGPVFDSGEVVWDE